MDTGQKLPGIKRIPPLRLRTCSVRIDGTLGLSRAEGRSSDAARQGAGCREMGVRRVHVPLEISFRDIPKSVHIMDVVREQAVRLGKVCDRVMSFRVAIERPQEAGNPYRVWIHMRVPPGKEIVVSGDPRDTGRHDELREVVFKAFKRARRRLRGLAKGQCGKRPTRAEASVRW
jgi:hypothetical protein